MGDDTKKSFWTSLPGILTGIAAVIVAVGGILAAYNHVIPSSPSSSPSASSPLSSSQQVVCGTQLPGVALFGTWRWAGTVYGRLRVWCIYIQKRLYIYECCKVGNYD